MSTPMEATPNAMRGCIEEVFSGHNHIALATQGGPVSPWILNAYFASEGLSVYMLLETSGKSMQNILADKKVAFSISSGDAMKDFVQASGRVVVLPQEEEARVRALIVAKMPWFQTFTPVVPVRVDVETYFVSSFARGWFPARQLKPAQDL